MDSQYRMKTFATSPKTEPTSAIPCVLCGSSAFEPLWDLGAFSFVHCVQCGLVQQNPQPDEDFVLARYDNIYKDYEVARQGDYARLEMLALGDLRFPATEAAARDRAASEGRRPRFLDVGCATGALMAGLIDSGWECVGVEPCEPAALFGRETFGLDIRVTVLEKASLPSRAFDVVHASHVIEHLNDPALFLAEAQRLIVPGGRLIVTTPNIDGLQARILGSRWRSAIYDHLYLFSKKNLKLLLERNGFEVIRTATWGGWAAGLRPAFIKKPFDRAVKAIGLGDVMAFLCEPRAVDDRQP